jgi:predicted transcriptional regulator
MDKISTLQRNFETFNENFKNLDEEYWNLSKNCHDILKKIEETPDDDKKSTYKMELLSTFTSLQMKINEISVEQDKFLLKSIKTK